MHTQTPGDEISQAPHAGKFSQRRPCQSKELENRLHAYNCLNRGTQLRQWPSPSARAPPVHPSPTSVLRGRQPLPIWEGMGEFGTKRSTRTHARSTHNHKHAHGTQTQYPHTGPAGRLTGQQTGPSFLLFLS